MTLHLSHSDANLFVDEPKLFVRPQIWIMIVWLIHEMLQYLRLYVNYACEIRFIQIQNLNLLMLNMCDVCCIADTKLCS